MSSAMESVRAPDMTHAASATAFLPPLAPVGSTRRSLQLFQAFRVEQSDPDRFYGLLAVDSVREVQRFADLSDAVVLDVGGGPGYFADAFTAAGARYAALDADAGELRAAGLPRHNVIMGSGLRLPIADASVVSWTTWYSLWGGHETSPWHYLGGHYAARRYERRHGRRPKNDFGRTLFAAHVGPTLRFARTLPDAQVIAAYPRYHPRWAHFVARIPLVREPAVWNLMMVLRRTSM